MHVLYDTETNRLLGRARGTEPNSVEVSNELWGRIAADLTAFIYVPASGTVELDPAFQMPVEAADIQDHAQHILNACNEEFYVPELDIALSFAGDFGPHLLRAVTLAQHAPQTIVGRRNGSITTIILRASDLPLIANAYATLMEIDDD